MLFLPSSLGGSHLLHGRKKVEVSCMPALHVQCHVLSSKDCCDCHPVGLTLGSARGQHHGLLGKGRALVSDLGLIF